MFILTVNYSNLGDHVDHIYPVELGMDFTDIVRSASYLDPTPQNWQCMMVLNETREMISILPLSSSPGFW